jgi:hypothetical protein
MFKSNYVLILRNDENDTANYVELEGNNWEEAIESVERLCVCSELVEWSCMLEVKTGRMAMDELDLEKFLISPEEIWKRK